ESLRRKLGLAGPLDLVVAVPYAHDDGWMGRVGRRAVVDLAAEVDDSHGGALPLTSDWAQRPGRQPGWCWLSKTLKGKHIKTRPGRAPLGHRMWRSEAAAGWRSLGARLALRASCGPRAQALALRPSR